MKHGFNKKLFYGMEHKPMYSFGVLSQTCEDYCPPIDSIICKDELIPIQAGSLVKEKGRGFDIWTHWRFRPANSSNALFKLETIHHYKN